MSPQDMEDQIEGRKLAKEFTELAEDSSHAFKRGIALHMRAYADSILGPIPTELRVMTNQEADSFGKTAIDFGVHKGTAFHDVPLFYLTWIADKSALIQAYLRSEIVLKRINEAE